MVKTGTVVGVLPLGACRVLGTLSRIGRTSDGFKLSVNKFPSDRQTTGQKTWKMPPQLAQPLQENRCQTRGTWLQVGS